MEQLQSRLQLLQQKQEEISEARSFSLPPLGAAGLPPPPNVSPPRPGPPGLGPGALPPGVPTLPAGGTPGGMPGPPPGGPPGGPSGPPGQPPPPPPPSPPPASGTPRRPLIFSETPA
eukprot:2880314-Ditylum_brightwellii.AAC.1